MSNRSADKISSLETKLNPGTVFVQNCIYNQVINLYQLGLTTGKA